MRELIGPVMVSSLYLTFGSLPSAVFPASSKGGPITTLGTRWHDFFHYTF